jgi:hypothetical protein
MDRIIEGIVARITGPLHFRFILQPVVAILLGIRDGLADARAGTPPFIYDLLLKPADRRRDLKSALKSLLTPIIVATILDCIVQYLIFKHIRLVPALIVGAFVMGVPYSLARGITNRIATHRRHKKAAQDAPKSA